MAEWSKAIDCNVNLLNYVLRWFEPNLLKFMGFFLRKHALFFTPSISNHYRGNFRGIKTAKTFDSDIPATFMYNNAFLIFKNKAKNGGVALKTNVLPEDQFLFYYSLKNVKKNYITSVNQFGGERFNLEEQMTVMLPSSNLESEA